MDKLTWFKFVISDWMMGKIQKCPEVTQARFMRLCCLYWNKECKLSYEDADIEIDKEHLDILINKKIIISDSDFIKIKFLDEQSNDVNELSNKRREAVKERWDKKKNTSKEIQSDTIVLKNDTIVIQSDTEKRREEERREEKNILNKEQKKLFDDFCEFFEYTSPNFQTQQSLIWGFVFSLPHKNKLDFVIKEFASYSELKKLDGYKHSLENFLGKQSEQFKNGKWDDNWTQKLLDYKNKNGIAEVKSGESTLQKHRRKQQEREAKNG